VGAADVDRFSIFNLFDDLLLLGRGGRTVFLAPSYMAVPYFVSLGWSLPEGENPADFVLDVVAGTEINRQNAQMINTVRSGVL
jgi:ABC-2 type transporter